MPAIKRESAPKHSLTFAYANSLDTPDELACYLISATPEQMDGVGGHLLNEGTTLPGADFTTLTPIKFNDDVRQKLQWMGLQLMGAFTLDFEEEVTLSPDNEFHLIWHQDTTDCGKWTLELQVPIQMFGDGGGGPPVGYTHNSDGTWSPYPSGANDVRFNPAPPPWPSGSVPSGQTAQCLSAANNEAALKNCIDGLINVINAGGVVLSAMGVIESAVSLFLPISFVPDLLSFLASAALLAGGALLTAAFTSDVYKTYKCILDRHAEADGSFTKADWQSVVDDTQSQLTSGSLERDIIWDWLQINGSVGLTRMGKPPGVTSADCSDCGWEHIFLFTDHEYATDWHAEPASGFTPSSAATYASGNGWESVYINNSVNYFRICGIESSTVATITRIEIYPDISLGFSEPGSAMFALYINGTREILINEPGPVNSPQVWVPGGSIGITDIIVQLFSGASSTPGDPGGTAKVTKIVIFGPAGTTDPYSIS